MADPIVVDLSHHNPTPNWQQLKAGGVVGVILKATEGTSFIDKTYADRRKAATAAGLAVASYHFLKHGSIAAQMEHYLDTVSPLPGERVVIDYEDAACTLGDLRDAVALLFNAGLYLQVTVYSGHLIKEQLGSSRDEELVGTSLWIAQYTSASAPGWPSGTWPYWSLWQYTDRATVPGISQPVDGNRFNGSEENCALWLAPSEAIVPPAPPELAEVHITTKGPVTVWVNGVPV